MDSSRIFVRGLPPNLTPDDFVRHFSKDLPITDAKLIPHRRIGYVGYKSPMDAAMAVKYHNKTFIRMSRIGVELACSVRSRGLKQLTDAKRLMQASRNRESVRAENTGRFHNA